MLLVTFLQATNHNYLRLCGPKNNIIIYKLIVKNNPETNATNVIIGRGWKLFCSSNNIHQGTHLEFTGDSIMAKNTVSVSRHYQQY